MNSNQTISVSFVIPTYNGASLLDKHLPDVIKASRGAEIIVVDDRSTDDSLSLLQTKFPQVRVVKLQTNQRFAAACNAGVAAASGEIIVLLNSDVSPDPGFLPPLLSRFADPQVFAVGCREIQDIEGRQFFGRAGGDFKRGMFIHWRSRNQDGEDTLWASGGSGAFRKQVWHELGGMDIDFAPAYEEDRDLCYRALKRGYVVKFAPDSFVFHQHETTNAQALGLMKMKASAHKNNLLFIWKNITDIKLIFLHWLFLPYHLTVTTVKTQGLFLIGFLWALTKLPSTLSKRTNKSGKHHVSDTEIIKVARTY